MIPQGEYFENADSLLRTASRRSPIFALAWSPDGGRLATGSSDGVVQIWEVASGIEERRFEPYSIRSNITSVASLSFRRDGRLLAASYEDGVVRLWNLDSGSTEELPIFGRFAMFSHNSSLLAIGSEQGGLAVWDPDQERALWDQPEAHDGPITSICWSGGDEILVTASANHDVRRWSRKTGDPLGATVDAGAVVFSIACDSQGRSIAIGSSVGVSVFEPVEGAQPSLRWKSGESPGGRAYSVGWHMEEALLVSGWDGGEIVLWNQDGSPRFSAETVSGTEVTAIAWGRHGMLFAAASAAGEVEIWDARTESVIKVIEGQSAAVSALAWSADGERFVAASDDRTARIWDLKDRIELDRLEIPPPLTEIAAVAISPTGRTIATGLGNGYVCLWEEDSQGELTRYCLPGHAAGVSALAWSVDGRYLASGSTDQTVRLWDIARKIDVHDALSGHLDTILSLAWSPDGSMLVSGGKDRSIFVWDVQTGQRQRDLGEQPGRVLSLAWSESSLLVVTRGNRSREATLLRLDPASGQTVASRPLLSGEWDAEVLEIDPEGRILAVSRVNSGAIGLLQDSGEVAGYALEGVFLGGRRGIWASCQIDHRCLRRDDGSLLTTLGPRGEVEAQKVLGAPGSIEIEAAIDLPESPAVPIEGGSLTIQVENGLSRAYWVRARQAAESDPRLLAVQTSAPLAVLEPGDSAEVSLQVFVSESVLRRGQESGNLHLEIVDSSGGVFPISPIQILVPSQKPWRIMVGVMLCAALLGIAWRWRRRATERSSGTQDLLGPDVSRDLKAPLDQDVRLADRPSLIEWVGGHKSAHLVIVFTDIVGSTRLSEKLGDTEWSKARNLHLDRGQVLVDDHGGFQIKTTGDGLVAAFFNAVQAIDFAISYAGSTGDERIHIRVGVHSGPVEIEAFDAHGQTMHRAQRICSVADDGDVLVSDEVKMSFDTVRKARSYVWQELPKQELRGFHGEFVLWAVERESIEGSLNRTG